MLHRRPLVASLLTGRPDNLLAVTSLGTSTWDITAAGDDPRNFCFIGAMGQAGPFALGLAMAQREKRILWFAGDGDLLMSLGVLATIANQGPANLAIVVLDNESYVETGGQPTATAGPTDLEVVARGCGIVECSSIKGNLDIQGLQKKIWNDPGPVFVNIKVVQESLPLVFPHSFDGAVQLNRFREAATS